jgi:NADPH2:quinone reductase
VKAAVARAFAPIESLEIGELPDPVLGQGQVVIDVKAAEINYPDILVISGQYQIKPPLPFAPGKAAAGIVSAVGSGVTDLKVGDHVAAQVEYGAFAENCSPPPSTYSPCRPRLTSRRARRWASSTRPHISRW